MAPRALFRSVLAVLIGLNTGCSPVEPTAPPPAAPAAAGCAVRLRADLPLEIVDYSLLVSVRIDGRPARLLVDTGWDGDLGTSPALVQQLGLTPRSKSTWSYRTAASEGLSKRVRVASLEVGDVRKEKVVATVASPPVPNLDGRAVDGVLGADFLDEFDIEIDPDAKRLRLHQVSGCDAITDPLPMPFDTVSLQPGVGSHLLMPVRIDGHLLLGLVDTGTSFTSIFASSAERIGRTRSDLRRGPAYVAHTPNGETVPFRVVQFEQVQIGPHHASNVDMPVIESRWTPADVIVGADYLAAQRTWISYATDKLFVARAAATANGSTISE